MKKIPTVFQRNFDTDRLVRNEVTPGCEWVLNGEGTATQKWDGTAVLIQGGEMFKRYDAKTGRIPPEDFMPAQPEPDYETGHWPGWVPLTVHDIWHHEALTKYKELNIELSDGTYELVGPKINGNPEQCPVHSLWKHGTQTFIAPRTFDEIKTFLETRDIEGIVWYHPDGRMAKIKKKDFGLKR